MPESLAPLWLLLGLFGSAALVLWLIEGLARLLGSRNTWLLFLFVLPLAASVAVSVANWEHLAWWQRVAYPLSGPVAAAALLVLGFAAVNPADAILLVCGLVRKAWQLAGGGKGKRPDDA